MNRTLTALTLGTSLLVHGNIISASRVIFYLPWIFKFPLPEVWRSVTSFWVTGPNQSILFDTYFCEPRGPTPLHVPVLMSIQVWTYSSGLEKESGRFSQPGDFFTYIIFLGLVILVRSHRTPFQRVCAFYVHDFHAVSFCGMCTNKPHISARPAISS